MSPEHVPLSLQSPQWDVRLAPDPAPGPGPLGEACWGGVARARAHVSFTCCLGAHSRGLPDMGALLGWLWAWLTKKLVTTPGPGDPLLPGSGAQGWWGGPEAA